MFSLDSGLKPNIVKCEIVGVGTLNTERGKYGTLCLEMSWSNDKNCKSTWCTYFLKLDQETNFQCHFCKNWKCSKTMAYDEPNDWRKSFCF